MHQLTKHKTNHSMYSFAFHVISSTLGLSMLVMGLLSRGNPRGVRLWSRVLGFDGEPRQEAEEQGEFRPLIRLQGQWQQKMLFQSDYKLRFFPENCLSVVKTSQYYSLCSSVASLPNKQWPKNNQTSRDCLLVVKQINTVKQSILTNNGQRIIKHPGIIC